jgi:hypothetical protein
LSVIMSLQPDRTAMVPLGIIFHFSSLGASTSM